MLRGRKATVSKTPNETFCRLILSDLLLGWRGLLPAGIFATALGSPSTALDIERHQASGEKRIDRARRLDRELRVKFRWFFQVAQTLLEQRRYLLQTRGRGHRALARRVVILFQQ